MTKDVIYIDVEDDITTIVGKIKASKEKIIALVPPARVGVLQSAVSMRLIKRTAEQADKRVVLISNNQSLMALAGAAKIPVARNLQSKPELPDIPVLKVDEDDIIDGEMLPVGELAGSTKVKDSDVAVTSAIQSSNIETESETVKKSTKKTKVPNFSSFRKKFLLIGGSALAFIIFMVWAIWFAPRATVIITAKTTTVTVDKNVGLTTDGKTDAKAGVVKSIEQEQKKDLAVEFTPTGKKKVGDKATGTVKIKTDAATILLTGLTVPAGTQIASSGGMTYATTKAAVFPKGDASTYSGVNVGVAATEVGSEYNGASGAATTSAAGVSSVSFVGATSGGTSKEVTVVSEDDVKKASEKLAEQKDESLRTKLKESFGSSSVIIAESYQEDRSDPAPSVAIDAEANGPVTLKTTITASIMAIDEADLTNFLKDSVQAEIKDKKSQKIYSNGSDKAKFAQFTANEDGITVRLTANATVGPTIDEAAVKEQAKGKNYGDIQSSLESIEGVEDVDTKFWPFWVRTVPNDVKRITVEFKLQNAN